MQMTLRLWYPGLSTSPCVSVAAGPSRAIKWLGSVWFVAFSAALLPLVPVQQSFLFAWSWWRPERASQLVMSMDNTDQKCSGK